MKKIIAIIIMVCILSIFTACNYQVFDLNYKYTNAYVQIGNEWVDLKIDKWRDYEDGEQIQLTLKDGTVMLVSSINCILYDGELPKGE